MQSRIAPRVDAQTIRMEYILVLGTSVLSVVVLFLLTKLLGNKQISQLSMFDYIIGISIGSIAAQMATDLESPLRSGLAMIVYALIGFLISLMTRKSVAFRKFATGKPFLLMDNGVILRDNLKRARFDISDFQTLCRIAGYFDLSQIQTAILEQNGTVSFLPKEVNRPATPADFALFPAQTRVMSNVILDGHVMRENLKKAGRDEAWLMSQLRLFGYSAYQEIFLAACDEGGALQIYPMRPNGRPWDPFE